MRRKIPSTNALNAFEAAARHASFTEAANELALTQSAVCRQIAGLEDFLGVKLFRRSRRGVVLTEAGATYHRKVAQRLDEVERDTLDLMAHQGRGGTLELAVVPTFGTRWLLPRLRSWRCTTTPGFGRESSPSHTGSFTGCGSSLRCSSSLSRPSCADSVLGNASWRIPSRWDCALRF